MEENKMIIEALIFASDNPLSADRVAEIIPDVKKDEISRLIRELMREYEERRGGIYIQEVAGGFQFRSRENLGSWINRMRGGKSLMLSPAAMETLAVVAYRQPVVKSEIDKIRGVDVSGSLRGLLEKKFVRIMGRKDVPGKPIVYGTTKKFLEVFNLKDLSELPTLRELKDLK
jgi:segregation and condensation protein B